MRPVIIAVLALVSATALQAQAKECSLKLSGDVTTPLTVTSTDMAKLPKATIRASDHGQAEAVYEGVRVADVLALAGVQLNLRGPGLVRYAVASASDGYRVLFSLAEFDTTFVDTPVIIALTKNGAALDSTAGPCRLVVAGQKRPARWIRMLTGIEVRKAE